jgi:hypothetical protein
MVKTIKFIECTCCGKSFAVLAWTDEECPICEDCLEAEADKDVSDYYFDT